LKYGASLEEALGTIPVLILEEELWMSTSTWGEPEPFTDETDLSALLKYFLKQMMVQFGAHGACIALYDESINQMKIQAHVRLQHLPPSLDSTRLAAQPQTLKPEYRRRQGERTTINLLQDPQQPYSAHMYSLPSLTYASVNTSEEIEDITPQQSELFAVGTTYPIGHDLIGYIWQKNEAYSMRHEDYLSFFSILDSFPLYSEVTPSAYLVVPIRETTLLEEVNNQKPRAFVLGVIALYQIAQTGSEGNALLRYRVAAQQYVERVALYLQNYQLQRARRRTSEYLQRLQNISTVFPSSVKLINLVEHVYQFVLRVVDVSSMLLTLHDRDLKRLYDVFALRNGQRIEGLAEQPVVRLPEERQVWWHVTQEERHTLQFSPQQEPQKAQMYEELLTGIWGDQRQAGSFLLLPMKMFTRVIGALCLTSNRPNAYHPEEILVLETMVQIVTVSVENAKLYERDRDILLESKQRETQLSVVNSALQTISSSLNVTELLNNLVISVVHLLRVNMCVFFQLSQEKQEFSVQALYAPPSAQMHDDGTGMPVMMPPNKGKSDELMTLIRLPFTDTVLEQRINEGFFYLEPAQLEELAQKSSEGGAIFLREIGIHHVLIIPMNTQENILGFLAVPTPNGMHCFRPKDVSTLLMICAQTVSAIRNAQVFEEREEAYAEMKRMSELRDEFLVTASHELRTPLTAISGYSSQLKRQSARANPQQILRFATKISVASQQLIDMIANMTEAAQIGAVEKHLDLHLEAVQLLAATESAVNMLAFKFEQSIEIDVEPDLWVLGDPPRVRQVLTNLLENAAKYVPAESIVRVQGQKMQLSQVVPLLSADQIDHTYLREHHDMWVVLIRVIDQGEGIDPEDQTRIFEKFVRATRVLTTPVRGSGLGLYICRRFVNAMSGKLWLEKSIPNEGSTFSFYLPFIEPPIGVGL
jgi:signal transduction histidine kinase